MLPFLSEDFQPGNPGNSERKMEEVLKMFVDSGKTVRVMYDALIVSRSRNNNFGAHVMVFKELTTMNFI